MLTFSAVTENIVAELRVHFSESKGFNDAFASTLKVVVESWLGVEQLTQKLSGLAFKKYFGGKSLQQKKKEAIEDIFATALIALVARKQPTNIARLSGHELLVAYPDFAEMKDMNGEELAYLVEFHYFTLVFLSVFGNKHKKRRCLAVAGKLEGSGRRDYITGTGQSNYTKRRVKIYEKEGNVTPEKRSERSEKKRALEADTRAVRPSKRTKADKVQGQYSTRRKREVTFDTPVAFSTSSTATGGASFNVDPESFTPFTAAAVQLAHVALHIASPCDACAIPHSTDAEGTSLSDLIEAGVKSLQGCDQYNAPPHSSGQLGATAATAPPPAPLLSLLRPSVVARANSTASDFSFSSDLLGQDLFDIPNDGLDGLGDDYPFPADMAASALFGLRAAAGTAPLHQVYRDDTPRDAAGAAGGESHTKVPNGIYHAKPGQPYTGIAYADSSLPSGTDGEFESDFEECGDGEDAYNLTVPAAPLYRDRMPRGELESSLGFSSGKLYPGVEEGLRMTNAIHPYPTGP